MKKLALSLILVYVIVATVVFTYILTMPIIAGKIVLGAGFLLLTKTILGWAWATVMAVEGTALLKEKYPESFKEKTK